jgi:hypothetical protein
MRTLFVSLICTFPFVLVGCGTALLLKRNEDMARGSGALAMLAGTLIGASMLRGVGFRNLLLQQTSTKEVSTQPFALRHVAVIRDFAAGDAELSSGDSSEPSLKDVIPLEVSHWTQLHICSVWKDSFSSPKSGLVLLIGATDRVPLSPRARKRYESNIGLAQARADAVNTLISKTCGIPSEKMLSLVAGPHITPANPPDSLVSASGFGEDRDVDIWAIWNSDDLTPELVSLPTLSLRPLRPTR